MVWASENPSAIARVSDANAKPCAGDCGRFYSCDVATQLCPDSNTELVGVSPACEDRIRDFLADYAKAHDAMLTTVSEEMAAICKTQQDTIMKLFENISAFKDHLSERLEKVESEVTSHRHKISDVSHEQAVNKLMLNGLCVCETRMSCSVDGDDCAELKRLKLIAETLSADYTSVAEPTMIEDTSETCHSASSCCAEREEVFSPSAFSTPHPTSPFCKNAEDEQNDADQNSARHMARCPASSTSRLRSAVSKQANKFRQLFDLLPIVLPGLVTKVRVPLQQVLVKICQFISSSRGRKLLDSSR